MTLLTTTAITLYINYLNETAYRGYTDIAYVKNELILSNFMLIYIVADLLSSLIAVIYINFIINKIVVRNKIDGLGIEAFRFILLHAILIVIIQGAYS